MPKVHRLGDLNDGGGIITSIPQSTVFANGLSISVDGSSVSAHIPHPPTITANGSNTVIIEGIRTNRLGDADLCGHKRVDGSPNVFVGS